MGEVTPLYPREGFIQWSVRISFHFCDFFDCRTGCSVSVRCLPLPAAAALKNSSAKRETSTRLFALPFSQRGFELWHFLVANKTRTRTRMGLKSIGPTDPGRETKSYNCMWMCTRAHPKSTLKPKQKTNIVQIEKFGWNPLSKRDERQPDMYGCNGESRIKKSSNNNNKKYWQTLEWIVFLPKSIK